MKLIYLDFPGRLKRTITSNIFEGEYICDGENSAQYHLRGNKQFFTLYSLTDKNDTIILIFEQIEDDIILSIEDKKFKLIGVPAHRNSLIFLAKDVQYTIMFNT